MTGLDKGQLVRIDIPDETDPDFQYHREKGRISKILQDDADEETGDPRDSKIYRVKLESGAFVDFRWRDLRPAPDN